MESHHAHHHHDHHHDGDEPAEEEALAEPLDLDAEVLHDYLGAPLSTGSPGRRPTSRPAGSWTWGCGTGTGSLALLGCFPGSAVTAVDASGPMLDHLRNKARELDVASRVRVVQADLDAGWPDTGPADLAWASNSMHDMSDPDRVLARRSSPLLSPPACWRWPRWTPSPGSCPTTSASAAPGSKHAATRPGTTRRATRCRIWARTGAPAGPTGFAVEAERTFVIGLEAPLPAAASRYALLSLQRVRSAIDGLISAEDLAALGTLLDTDGPAVILRRVDHHRPHHEDRLAGPAAVGHPGSAAEEPAVRAGQADRLGAGAGPGLADRG